MANKQERMRPKGLDFAITAAVVALVIMNLLALYKMETLANRIQGLEFTSAQDYQAPREPREIKSADSNLEISDVGKINIREAPTSTPDTWEWQIYVPSDTFIKWSLAFVERAPSKEDVRRTNSVYPTLVDTSEEDLTGTIVAKLRRYDDDEYCFSAVSPFGGISLMIPKHEMDWIENAAMISSDEFYSSESGQSWISFGNSKTECIETRDPVHLLVLSYRAPSGEARIIELSIQVLDAKPEFTH